MFIPSINLDLIGIACCTFYENHLMIYKYQYIDFFHRQYFENPHLRGALGMLSRLQSDFMSPIFLVLKRPGLVALIYQQFTSIIVGIMI